METLLEPAVEMSSSFKKDHKQTVQISADVVLRVNTWPVIILHERIS